jgi:hypothetical protein
LTRWTKKESPGKKGHPGEPREKEKKKVRAKVRDKE